MRAIKPLALWLFFLILFLPGSRTLAQISTDDSLGTPAEPLQGPNYTIGQNLGKRAGKNLFHSFHDFNINTNESATFTGDATIERVISRVTGGNTSTIDGLLKSEVLDADFFLVNPAGVLFGPNATIDINGSFNVSTADYLKFGDNDQFFSQPLENEVLSTEAPTAYGFLGAEIGTISFDQSGLVVNESETISIISGDMSLSASHLEAPSGNINLISVASEGEVKINDFNLNVVPVDAANFFEFGDITLSDATVISANGEGSGVLVHGATVLLDDAIIDLFSQASVETGNIVISAESDLRLQNGAQIRIASSGDGMGGNIMIAAKAIMLQSGATVVDENGLESFIASGIFLEVESDGDSDSTTVNGGNISISTDTLEITDGAQIRVTTDGFGNAGNIGIEATEIFLSGAAFDEVNEEIVGGITTDLDAESFDAKGGKILVETETLEIFDGASITAFANTLGTGGDIEIEAETIRMSTLGSDFDSGIFTVGFGEREDLVKSGDIVIDTQILELLDGAQISAATFTSGEGGNVTIVADEILISGVAPFFDEEIGTILFPSAITTDSLAEITGGDGGNIRIVTSVLAIREGGQLSANSLNTGNAGDITIEAEEVLISDVVVFDTPEGVAASSSEIVSESLADENGGDGGDINLIDVTSLRILRGGQISASTFNEGTGGNIDIDARTIVMSNQDIPEFDTGVFTTSLGGTDGGAGGDILVKTQNMDILEGAQVNAISVGDGDGGDIRIEGARILVSGTAIVDSPDSVFAFPSAIATDAFSGAEEDSRGNGGDLSVTADELIIKDTARISASATSLGNSGVIIIDVKKMVMVNSAIDAEAFQATGGNVNIHSQNSIELRNSLITAQANLDGGNIDIDTNGILNLSGSEISAEAGNNGGNINLSNQATLLQNSQLNANATFENAGNVFINTNGFFANANGLFVEPDEAINVSSQFGVSGTIEIAAPDIDLTSGLVPLSEEFLDIDSRAFAKCSTKYERGDISTFHVISREGISLAPDDLLPSFSPLSFYDRIERE